MHSFWKKYSLNENETEHCGKADDTYLTCCLNDLGELIESN